MSMKRRTVLHGAVAGGAASAAVGVGLVTPREVLAAWPKMAFDAKTTDDAMKSLFAGESAAESGDIKLKAPDIAENGAVVPVSVKTSLSNVESISIVVDKNPSPLAAHFEFGAGFQGAVSTRIKMGKTSNVMAVVKADGNVYTTTKEVKVTIGGCGG